MFWGVIVIIATCSSPREGSFTSLHLHRNLELIPQIFFFFQSPEDFRIVLLCNGYKLYRFHVAQLNQSRQSHRTLEIAVVNQRNLVIPVVPWVGRCPEDPLTLRLVSLLLELSPSCFLFRFSLSLSPPPRRLHLPMIEGEARPKVQQPRV